MRTTKDIKEFQQIDGVRVPKELSVERESPARSIAKAISWRIIASVTTFLIFYFTAGGKVALEVITAAVGVELISKMGIYYVHERVWANVYWGRSWMRYKLIRRIKLNYIKRQRKNRNINI
ncbi:MAG: DUF2061 domain-containing protein [Bacteroidales bacterium]|nr:DUF2061 domain-containing protein [Bacteroidales bacterium]